MFKLMENLPSYLLQVSLLIITIHYTLNLDKTMTKRQLRDLTVKQIARMEYLMKTYTIGITVHRWGRPFEITKTTHEGIVLDGDFITFRELDIALNAGVLSFLPF